MNEPIAWMHTKSKKIFKTEKPNEFDLPLFTSLYTHPISELTDEEIEEVYSSIPEIKGYAPIYEFARALLKKANEK